MDILDTELTQSIDHCGADIAGVGEDGVGRGRLGRAGRQVVNSREIALTAEGRRLRTTARTARRWVAVRVGAAKCVVIG